MVAKPLNTPSTHADAGSPPVVGFVGGVGSGKSTLARWLAERLDAGLIDADVIGHEVLQKGAVRDQIRSAFGNAILSESGDVDRPKLAAVVFGQSDEHRQARERLENIVHPVIRERIGAEIERLKAETDCPCILLDAAILFEAGWHDRCNFVVFVDAPIELRQQRSASRGWDAETHRRREASQMSVDRKREMADIAIANTGDVAAAGQAVIEALTSRGFIPASSEAALTHSRT